jgi:hypothetical protein
MWRPFVPSNSSVVVVCDSRLARQTQADGGDAWWLYGLEVLGHLRLAARVAESAAGAAADDLLVSLSPLSGDALAHAQAGGVVLALGGPGDRADELGIASTPVETGLVRFGDAEPIRAFGGAALDTSAGEVLAEWTDGRPAVVSVAVGSGVVQVWGVDPWQSIVRIQQGWPISGKGEPAPDGSVPMHDGILRCDDGLAMPYEDRRVPSGWERDEPFELQYPPQCPAPMYDRPHADLWRVRVLEAIAQATSGPLAWLHYWPAGVEAIAHLSHDSDGNKDVDAQTALAAFGSAGVSATWCHCHPGGYSPEVVKAIADAGHEQALHYNAREDTPLDVWGLAEAKAQLAWAEELTGVKIVSNKNHYTRWEGWTEFFDWCEELGIEIDESRGPSKQGDVGFPFGSAHVWFPIADHAQRNRMYDVLELPLHTQDLAWAGHEAIREPILDGAAGVHGVAHFLFHGGNMTNRPGVVPAFHRLVEAVAGRGMPWWTAGEINAWERSRRAVELSINASADGFAVQVEAAHEVAGAGIVLRLPGGTSWTAATADGTSLPVAAVTRHGLPAVEIRVDLPVGETQIVLRSA